MKHNLGRDEGEKYLIKYPELRKWINECNTCHTKGYKPEMPVQIYPHFSAAADNLRRYFKPLVLSEAGLCETCNKLLR